MKTFQQSQESYQNQQSFSEQQFIGKTKEVLQEQYFQLNGEKLIQVKKRIEEVKLTITESSQFSDLLEENIRQIQHKITISLNKSKIYIVFMGTISSGKSTFINALLGQQLLSSRNQSCTSQVIYIEHQNVNANQNTSITINGKEFDSVKLASEDLKEIQIDPNVKVKIQTQSYFHKSLAKDYQDRIIFIDTPGIELVNCSTKEYKQKIDDINKQIELDEYSQRINVWVSDYSTFDRDKQIQEKIISELNSAFYQFQQQYKIQKDNQIQKSNDENEVFFIINKFDKRVETQDQPIETVIQNIKDFLDPKDSIFKISASDALNYNIMNYSTEEEKKNFLKEYYKNEKQKLNWADDSKVEKFCKKKIEMNHNLIKNQDFYEFIYRISIRIKQLLDQMFDQQFKELNYRVELLDFSRNKEKIKNQLTESQKEEILKLLNPLENRKKALKNQINNLKKMFFQQIETIIQEAQTEINDKNQEQVINVCAIKTIAKIRALNIDFLEMTRISSQELLVELNSVFQQQQQQLEQYIIIYQQCELILNSLMEDQIFEIMKQQVTKQAEELFTSLDIRVNKFFLEQPPVYVAGSGFGFGSIFGGGFSWVLVTQFFNSTCIPIISITVTSSIFGGILFMASAAASYFGFSLIESKINQSNFETKLNKWKESLDKQSNQMVENYHSIYDKNLKVIKDLIESITK